MRGLRLLFLAGTVAAVVISPAARATHDPVHAFAGEWQMEFAQGQSRTGTLKIRAVAAAAGRAAQAGFKWGGWLNGNCTVAATQWYQGEFGRGSDTGPIVGCTSRGSGIFYLVFKSTQFGVEGGLFFSGPGGAVYAVFPTEPVSQQGEEFAVSFRRHFAGDGSGAEEPPQPRCGGRRISAREHGAGSPVCKLERVVFLEGTKYLRPAA